MSQPSRTDLDALLTQHRPAMLAFARRYVPGHDAEDVVQTASVQIWIHHSRFSGRSAWLTWALAIVRYAALSHLRSGNRRRQAEADYASMAADTTFPVEPLLLLTKADADWIAAYTKGEAPGTDRTHRRRLAKIRRAFRH